MANNISSKVEPTYSSCAQLVHDNQFQVMLLEPRPFRPFKTSEEYLYAMKEDLAEWLNTLYGLNINVDNFMKQLETGVLLCRHANHVLKRAREYEAMGRNSLNIPIPKKDVIFRLNVNPGTFQARDNVSNFISWCRVLQIHECLLFETDDLVMRKNEKSFILCLLEVARRGSKFGILAPTLVQFEEEIDRELAQEEENDDNNDESKSNKQIITNDLRSLHERVVELLSRCSCPTQYNLEYLSDGKYRIGDTKVLIFVRILRSHVMVRVGGGWDTLEHYLDKHDPCRCRSGHRYSYSARLSMTPSKGISNSPQMQVIYNRPNEATTPTSYPKRTQSNCRDVPQLMPQNIPKQSIDNTSGSSSLVQINSSKMKKDTNDLLPNNDRIYNKLSPSYSTNKSKISPPKVLTKTVIDTSSSEFSENESKLNNLTKNDSNSINNRIKKCSPRKILKTREDLTNSDGNKSSSFNRRYSESDESSIASDEVIGSANSNRKLSVRTGSKTFGPNNYINRTKSNKTQSSEDIRQNTPNKWSQNSKICHSIGRTPRTTSNSDNRRSSADNIQLESNGRKKYGSFPRSRSQSSQLRISESNHSKANETPISHIKPFTDNTDNTEKSLSDNNSVVSPANSCRRVKTWTFKQRSRLPINNDLYKPDISQSDSTNDFSDTKNEMKSRNKSSSNSDIKPQTSLELENPIESTDKLLEKMKNLVNEYDINQKNRYNYDDFDNYKHYGECPTRKAVISTGNKSYISKIPTLQ